MAAYSGKDGYVESGATKLAQITGWKLNCTSKNPEWSSSDTPGEMARVEGIHDAKGSFDFKLDDTSPAHGVLKRGASVTLNLYTTTGKKFVVPAIIDEDNYTTDISGGEVVGGSMNFSQRAAITYPS